MVLFKELFITYKKIVYLHVDIHQRETIQRLCLTVFLGFEKANILKHIKLFV